MKYIDDIGINENTFNKLFMSDEGVRNYQNAAIMNVIEKSTRPLSLEWYEKREVKTYVKEYSNYYKFNDFLKVYRFKRLSSRVRNDLDVQELLTLNRYGYCHTKSLMYSKKFDSSKIVTGFIDGLSYRYLHTWIEAKDKDTDIVVDYTKNLIMKRNDFLELVSAEVVNSIDTDIFNNDHDCLEAASFIVDKLYCCFNQELILDMKKNKQLIR